jgi:hypothetical protein
MHLCIYIHICIYLYVSMYIYIYIYRERERERELLSGNGRVVVGFAPQNLVEPFRKGKEINVGRYVSISLTVITLAVGVFF